MNSFWQYDGSVYEEYLQPDSLEPGYAFSIITSDRHLYYYTFFAIEKTSKWDRTICIISDMSNLIDKNISALGDFRSASKQLYSLTIIDDWENIAMENFPYVIDGVIKMTTDKSIGNTFFTDATSIWINDKHLGKRLVHYYFDFLIHLNKNVNISKEGLLITDQDIVII